MFGPTHVATHVVLEARRGDDGRPKELLTYVTSEEAAKDKYDRAVALAKADGHFGVQLLTVSKEYRVSKDTHYNAGDKL